VEIEEGGAGRRPSRSHGVNQILDDALGAFIDVLDQHTLADMATGQETEPQAPRRKPGSRAVAVTSPRLRRSLHQGG